MGTSAAETGVIDCRQCGVTAYMSVDGRLPPGWKAFFKPDYLDEYECNNDAS
jgi:hypothetical protein